MSNNSGQKEQAKRNGGFAQTEWLEYTWGIMLLIVVYVLNIIVWVML